MSPRLVMELLPSSVNIPISPVEPELPAKLYPAIYMHIYIYTIIWAMQSKIYHCASVDKFDPQQNDTVIDNSVSSVLSTLLLNIYVH